jgi:hypothetical protein
MAGARKAFLRIIQFFHSPNSDWEVYIVPSLQNFSLPSEPGTWVTGEIVPSLVNCQDQIHDSSHRV